MKSCQLIVNSKPLEDFLEELRGLLEDPLNVPGELINRLLGILESTDEFVSIERDDTASGAEKLLFKVDASDRLRELVGALRAGQVE